ncbi:hypothetical protein BKA69DRAFT_1093099 [Paraphysoderma sedebokerense]|nr:hypothetical protein BKA69DRAFT_1093099 [Paraphysoderma sedebokerense]
MSTSSSFDNVTPVYDERTELLRESAALGNLKAVQYYVSGGTDVNSVNKINGWTALHWAAKRNHDQVVQYLLRNGAKADVQTKQNQFPLDLTTSDSVRSMLRSVTPPSSSTPECPTPPESVDQQASEERASSFVPNYLANPDLAKTWSSPEELPIKPVVLYQKDDFNTSPIDQPNSTRMLSSAPEIQAALSRPLQEDSEFELIVAHNIPSNVVGAVFASPVTSIRDTVEIAFDELDLDVKCGVKDGSFDSFMDLYRMRNDLLIPIPQKQWNHSIGKHFRQAMTKGDICMLVMKEKSVE